MVKAEKVAKGLVNFAEAEMLPNLDGWQVWAAGAALVLMAGQADALVKTLADNPVVSSLGLVDANGNVDIDKATEAAKETTRKRGKLPLDLPVFGTFKLGEEDFDKLRQYIVDA